MHHIFGKNHTKLATVSFLHAGQHKTWTEWWVAPNCLVGTFTKNLIIQYGLIEQHESDNNATKHLKQQYFWPWIFSMKALFMDHDDMMYEDISRCHEVFVYKKIKVIGTWNEVGG